MQTAYPNKDKNSDQFPLVEVYEQQTNLQNFDSTPYQNEVKSDRYTP